MTKSKAPFSIGLLCVAAMAAGCGPNPNVLNSGPENKAKVNAATPRTGMDADMADMRTAGFTFIYTLKRKDGQKLDSADRSLIRTQTEDMNRRVSADEDRAVLIGSNYQLPEANLKALKERFTIETLVQPTQANTNGNANTTK
jgi:hypothetical protein